jgi:group I intron endonuclease
MIGIYKIVNPKGRIYIGQGVDLDRRLRDYSKLDCKGQPRLHASLVKYGFSEHIFEIIEQCKVEDLNIRERHWQDFYNVLSKSGMNCRLTGTVDRSGYVSKESTKKRVNNLKQFYKTPQGSEVKARTVANRKAFNQTPEGIEMLARKAANMNYSTFQKRKTSTTDWEARSIKNRKAIYQYSKTGILIQEWTSAKEAGETLAINKGSITTCCKEKVKSAGGFIWKYKI